MYPRRTAAMVGLLVFAGLAEGVGLLTLLPLLDVVMETAGPPADERFVAGLFRRWGLEPSLGTMLVAIVVAMTAKGVLLWLAMREVGFTIAAVSARLRQRLVAALVAARFDYSRDRPAGNITNASSAETRRAAWAYKDACSAFADSVQALIYVAVIVAISWRIAVFAPMVGGLLWLTLRGLVDMGRRAGERRTEAMQRFIRQLTAFLPNLKPVKAMDRERHLVAPLESAISDCMEAERRAVIAVESMTAFREPIIVLIMACGLFSAVAVFSLSFSLVLTTAVLFYRLLMIVGRVQSHWQAVAHGESAFWSMYDEIEAAERAAETVGRSEKEASRLDERIELRDLTVVAGDGTPILDAISLEIPARGLMAFVGPSGSGKTTAVDVVAGLVRPTRGEVLVDGVPLDAETVPAWRRGIGYVPQELCLFHDTIAANVTLGDDRFTDEEVRSALEAAGAWEFVAAHPDGIGRVIGERGGRISGGQGQRLMIARALVHAPRLLILDEATSGLDAPTEAAIGATLRRLSASLTVIVVSHQPTLRELADLVVTVRSGKIVSVEPGGPPAGTVPPHAKAAS